MILSTVFCCRGHTKNLFDRISKVIVERTPVGTIFGYATVSILTDSGVGIVDESMGAAGAVNMPGSADSPDDTSLIKQKIITPIVCWELLTKEQSEL